MTYKGYAARFDFSEDDGCFVCHIAGISDIVGFHDDSVAELRAVFEEAVDDYFETCKELDRFPQKPCSGAVSFSLAVAANLTPNFSFLGARCGRGRGRRGGVTLIPQNHLLCPTDNCFCGFDCFQVFLIVYWNGKSGIACIHSIRSKFCSAANHVRDRLAYLLLKHRQ